MASGAVTGLSSSPWVALPAALADTAAMIRIEAYVAARVALLFDEHYFEGEDPRYEKARAYRVFLRDGQVVEEEVPTHFLGEG